MLQNIIWFPNVSFISKSLHQTKSPILAEII